MKPQSTLKSLSTNRFQAHTAHHWRAGEREDTIYLSFYLFHSPKQASTCPQILHMASPGRESERDNKHYKQIHDGGTGCHCQSQVTFSSSQIIFTLGGGMVVTDCPPRPTNLFPRSLVSAHPNQAAFVQQQQRRVGGGRRPFFNVAYSYHFLIFAPLTSSTHHHHHLPSRPSSHGE